ncbi:MAG TPA: hypothetical protein VFB07_13035 [Vicinamibacterales bacterium]|nr:hypothetical protein [Vicinamibacterales bacterium]
MCGTAVALVLIGLVSLGGSGAQPPQNGAESASIKLGILPFADATASGNRAAGAEVARTLMAEVVHSTEVQPRMLALEGAVTADALDGETAISLGRAQHVDRVFIGTVLEAKSEESNKGGWIPSMKGQSGNVTLRRVKATVTLQGELYDVVSGRRLFSVRVSGHDSNTAVGGTTYTTFGSWGSDSYRNFLDSPLGKALQMALADMTKKIASAPSVGRER